MFLLPAGLLWFWFSGFLSLALLGGGGYVLWAWYRGIVEGDRWLVLGIALLAFSLLGRFLVLLLVGRRNGGDLDAPAESREGAEIHRLTRPDGGEIHVESYGPAGAPTLVLTHGWGLNSTEWFYARHHLAGRYRLLVWDLPGLGESSAYRDGDYSLDRMARDLKTVLDHVDGPVLLGGHSIGTMITLTFCRLFPDLLGTRVTGLVLTHTTYTNPVRTSQMSSLLTALQKPLLEPLCYLMIGLNPLVWLMSWLSYLNGMAHLHTHFSSFGGHESKGQLDYSVRVSVKAAPSVVARGFLAMFRYDATDVLPHIPVPVLVIAGNRDQATRPEAGERIRQSVPRGQLAELLPAGHLGLLEKHADWANAVDAFAIASLNSQAARRSS